MECACTVDMDVGVNSELISITTPKARKSHICTECGRMIHRGEEYRREFVKFDSTTSVYKTCEHCLSIREVFFSSGWYYGIIWTQMKEFVNDSDGDLSVSCLLDLTKTARDRVLDMIEETWED